MRKRKPLTKLYPHISHILFRISELTTVFQISGREGPHGSRKLSEVGEVVLSLHQNKPRVLSEVLRSAAVCDAAKA